MAVLFMPFPQILAVSKGRGLEGSHISIKNITTLIFHKNIQLWQIVLLDTLCILKLS
jgi:hypothetical protein